MKSDNNETTPKQELTKPEEVLGFLPEWIDEVVVGDTKDKNKTIYKKLGKKLEIEANNYRRTIDIYFSSASKDDTNNLLNYILPKQ